MKINVDIKGLASVQKTLRQLPKEIQEKALVPAINKTAAKAQAEINRAITQEYAVKAGEVRNSMELRKANKDRLEAAISIFGSASKRGRSANMVRFLQIMQANGIAFKTRSQGKGASVTRKDLKNIGKQLGFIIKRGGGVKTIEGAFLANKGRTVFIREGKARLPIKPVQVIGFSQMFSSKRISQRVKDKIESDMSVELERAIKMVLSR